MAGKKKENVEQAAAVSADAAEQVNAERGGTRARLWRRAAARRRLVAELRARGRTLGEIAAELRSNARTVSSDIDVLRDRAAAGPLVARPAACAALFSEEAEDVIRKVRALEDAYEGDDRKCTIYLNLLKLEFTMLVKFADLTGGLRTEKQGATDDEELEDWTKLSDEELINRAKEIGVDTTGFERAFAALGATAETERDADGDAA